MSSFGFFIDWQVGIALLWLLYRLALRGRVLHGAARVYLLAIVPVAAGVAALKLPVLAPVVVHVTQTAIETKNLAAATAVPVATVETGVDWFLILYYLVSIVIATLFGVGVVRWLVRWRGGFECGGVRFCAQGRVTASSMFGRVAVDPCCLGSDSLESIVAHERAHVAQRHSWDLLYINILRTALWINPFVWIIGRDLTLVHESQADAAVLDAGYSPERYIQTLLDAEIGAIGGSTPENLAPIHYFSFCFTKKRIQMMIKLFPSRRSLWRLAAAVPVLGSMLVLFSFTRPVVVEAGQTDAPIEELATRTQPALVVVYQKSAYDGDQFVEFRRSLEGEPKIDPAKIASISVLKGENAVEYMNLDPVSEAGKTIAAGGIIVIDMKGADPAHKTNQVMSLIKDEAYIKPLTQNFFKKSDRAIKIVSRDKTGIVRTDPTTTPLVIISAKTTEGKEVPIGISGSMQDFDPENIASMTIIKGSSAVDIYWKDATPEVRATVASNGLILLTLKETVDSDPAKRSFLARHITEEQAPVAKAFLRTIEAQKVTYAK